MCFWNLCFKVEDSGQSHWNRSEHGCGNCEVHSLIAQYYHRRWGFAWLHQTIVAALLQMAVISSKNPEYITLLPLLPNKRETYFVDFSTVQLVLYLGKWKLLETCNNSKSSLHFVITRTRFCISVHKFMYKPNTNAGPVKCSSIPSHQSRCCGSH